MFALRDIPPAFSGGVRGPRLAEILWDYGWDAEAWALLPSGVGALSGESLQGNPSPGETLPSHAHALALAQARARKRVSDHPDRGCPSPPPGKRSR